MTSDRAYRRALPHEVAVAEIERCSGTQFDPAVSHEFCEGLDDHREGEVAKGNRTRGRCGADGACRVADG